MIYVDSKTTDTKFEPISKAQLKKCKKMLTIERQKQPKVTVADDGEDAEKREQRLEAAKLIEIQEDKSLPQAKPIKISGAKQMFNTRVEMSGWVHRLRRQGNSAFIRRKCFGDLLFFNQT